MDNPTPANIAALQQIWQRIFQRSAIGVNEDFFELGGNAWHAAELFTQINRDLGVSMVPVTICQAPTVATLAGALSNPQRCSPAILLKQGAAQAAPIFMLHGIGSSIIDLVPLVRRMQVNQPIYGLEAQGNDGREAPLDRIEDIARSFLDAIRKVQPHGRYFLIGYSLGGLIALEVAQQLKAQSEEIGLLVMLDSYPDRRYLSLPQYARLFLQLATRRVSGRTKAAGQRRLIQAGDSRRTSLVHAMQHVKDTNYRALHNYRPSFYDGEVKFVRAEVASAFPADPVPVWSRLVRRLDVESVPGEHATLLTTSTGPLASLLDKYLRDAGA